MPRYRIFFNGTQVDLNAESHVTTGSDRDGVVEFRNETGHTVAAFRSSSLHGFVKIDSLVHQKPADPG